MFPAPIHCLSRISSEGTLGRFDWIWQTPQPPGDLWIQGTDEALKLLTRLPERGLAVVGTREPQLRTLQLIEDEIAKLKTLDLIVVSGFARGVDTQAHSSALDCGIPTVAFLGCGIDVVYPKENEKLKDRILEKNGLLISEFPLGSSPRPGFFISRNQLIAASCKAVWVAEAPYRSGALNTAKWARDQERQCYATPCFPGDRAYEGNQTLLNRDFALPFWGAHSLGHTWLEISSLLSLEAQRGREKQPTGSLYEKVIWEAKRLSQQQGGFTMTQLLDWALSQKMTPVEFFAEIQKAIELEIIFEDRGVLSTRENKALSSSSLAAPPL